MTLRRSRLSQPDRRPGNLPGRRFALALTVSLAVLGSAGAATADSGGTALVIATVYGPGGQQTTDSVTQEALQADAQRCPVYPKASMVEYSGGQPDPEQMTRNNPPDTGTWPMSTILTCLDQPIAVSQVTSLTVHADDGSPQVGRSSQLTPGDLRSPSDFQDSSDSPVVSATGGSTQYNRPWRGGSDSDASDKVVTSGPLSIDVYEGPPLTATATASPSPAAAGTSVTFTATVSGNGTSPLHYDWSFGDNLPDSSAASPTVTFADAGGYTVRLDVHDDDGGGGGTTVPITITGAQATSTPTGSTTNPDTTTGPHSTGDNPNGGTHGTTGGNGKGDNPRPSAGNGNGHHASTPAGSKSGPKPTSSHRQKPSHPGSGSSGTTGGAAGGATGGSTGDSGAPASSGTSPPTSSTPTPQTATTRARAHRAPTRTRRTSAAGPGHVVSGELIADVTPLPAGSSPLVRQVAGSAALAPPLPRPSHRSPWGIIAACLAVGLLLGLGAIRELGLPRGRWWPRPGT